MDETIDFAVVGAGIAGAYVAWRLSRAHEEIRKLFPYLFSDQTRKPVIKVFEGKDFVGGRLCSPTMPGMSCRAELGGMRYSGKQLFISCLVNHLRSLGLTAREFNYAIHSTYFRGAHSKAEEVPPYRVGLAEKCKNPGQLVEHAIRCALHEIGPAASEGGRREEFKQTLRDLHQGSVDPSQLSPRQWSLIKKHAVLHGSRLYDIGFWNLLSNYLSSEAFLFVHDVLGYETIVDNWNAAEAMPWFLRDFNVKNYFGLNQGMSAMPRALIADFLQRHPDSLFKNYALTSIAHGNDQRGEQLFTLTFSEKGQSRRKFARHVILAIPKEPLKRLFGSELIVQSGIGNAASRGALNRALDSVKAQPLFKLFLGYERAWWKDPRSLGCNSGRAVTDLPIRQIYYFEPDSKGRGMIMASYNDAHYVDFWKPLQRRKLEPFFYKGDPDLKEKRVLQRFGASDRMVRKAHRQAKQLHAELMATESIPEPFVALAKEWSCDDQVDGALIGAGWHTWIVHAKSWRVANHLKRPFRPDLNLYICGEAYSYEQGWIEGALRSSEMALKEIGIAPPEWVPGTEYHSAGFQDYDEYIGWEFSEE